MADHRIVTMSETVHRFVTTLRISMRVGAKEPAAKTVNVSLITSALWMKLFKTAPGARLGPSYNAQDQVALRGFTDALLKTDLWHELWSTTTIDTFIRPKFAISLFR